MLNRAMEVFVFEQYEDSVTITFLMANGKPLNALNLV